jgi:hypothetical protein
MCTDILEGYCFLSSKLHDIMSQEIIVFILKQCLLLCNNSLFYFNARSNVQFHNYEHCTMMSVT